MSENFVHLHVHTEYSLLDGTCRIPALIDEAVRLGMPAVAITDHGNMYGVIDFYLEAKKKNIKPIIGCEVYTVKGSRFDKNQQGREWGEYNHLILLAKNNIGYRNLMKIVSAGFIDGYYYRPRVDYEILKKYSDGLVCLSACLAGEIPKAILRNDNEEAERVALNFREIFGADNFFLELQNNGIPEENLVNSSIIGISKKTGIPMVCTNDVHYLHRDDAEIQDVLMCIQMGKTVEDTNRLKFSTDQFYFRTQEEMTELFSSIPSAIENTLKIAEMCNVSIDMSTTILPNFEVPNNEGHYDYLHRMCVDGIYRRYGENPSKEVFERLEYELNVVNTMGYVDYYLIVWDFIHYAKSHGIYVGPGRGSGAASIAAYALGITNLDPLKYDLIFERFLNPERISMPDFDVDFCIERRHEVIEYVERKYGKDKVSQIIAFGTMKAKMAIRDVGRVLNMSYSDVDRVAKMIPFDPKITIENALELNPDLKSAYDSDIQTQKLIDISRKLEGITRHASTHAAGVVITKDALTEYVPLQKNGDTVTTQYTMEILSKIGLVKMDFLGLRTLTVIRDTLSLIKQNTGKDIVLDELKFDDPKVFSLISEGKTVGIFQLESGGMTQFMKELMPTSFEDIVAGIALYRPGPMDQIPRYIENKRHPDNVTYAHPILENILDVTYGCMIYQEQVMRIFREMGGFSLGQADIIRRAMSKKKMSVMLEEKEKFINGVTDSDGNVTVQGALRNGVPKATAEKIYEEIMAFASYAFNKAHAACYGVVSYYTAWLKKYYTVEFMAATINSFIGSSGRVALYAKECENFGIKILPPDINKSSVYFSTENGNIRVGFSAVKGVGNAPSEDIVEERKLNGPYLSFEDFIQRINETDVNKKVVENFILCGVFDSLGMKRSQYNAVFEDAMNAAADNKRKNLEGQMSLFGESDERELKIEYPETSEYSLEQKLNNEKEILGLYVSGHPLNEYREYFARTVNFDSLMAQQIAEKTSTADDAAGLQINDGGKKDGDTVSVGGIITEVKTKTTKNGDIMAFIELEDYYGTLEIIVFPKIFSRYKNIISTGNIVVADGRLSVREDEAPKVLCSSVTDAKIEKNEVQNSETFKTSKKTLYIRIDDNFILKEKAFLSTLSFFNGENPVKTVDSEKRCVLLDRKYWWDGGSYSLSVLKDLLGDENVAFRERK